MLESWTLLHSMNSYCSPQRRQPFPEARNLLDRTDCSDRETGRLPADSRQRTADKERLEGLRQVEFPGLEWRPAGLASDRALLFRRQMAGSSELGKKSIKQLKLTFQPIVLAFDLLPGRGMSEKRKLILLCRRFSLYASASKKRPPRVRPSACC